MPVQTENNTHKPEPQKIQKMFSQVAQNYDKANSVLSLGIHHLWRKKLVKLSLVKKGDKVLDCATGTGDLAIEFKQKVGPTGQVIGTDFCPEMLAFAPQKAKNLDYDIQFEIADVTKLQFSDATFDVSSISFGIRNVGNPVLALQEMARVTKPKGRVMVLEFGQMQAPIVGSLFDYYSRKILPKVGGLISGQKEAYEYLQKSSARFPCGEEFKKMMQSTGAFEKVEAFPLWGGMVYAYRGTKK